MFSQVSYQPQVIAAVSHVTTILNTLRQGSSAAAHSRTGRSTRVGIQKSRTSVTEVSQAEPVGNEEQKAIDLDIDTCMSILALEENIAKLVPSVRLLTENSAVRDTWRTSYVSATTFFENKTGFDETMLKLSNPSSFMMFLNPAARQLLAQSSIGFEQQRRSIRTVAREQKIGIGGQTKRETDNWFASLFSLKSTSKKDLSNLLQKENPDSQEKIKIAFAEGYAAKPNVDQRENLFKKLKMAVSLGLLLWILWKLKGVSVSLKGDMPGPLNMFGQKYEATPEETFVTFDDVRGADEAKEELRDIVHFLKSPQKFEAVGAKLPKGVLLCGVPGIGKTLLAKAVAGEAGVPFFHASGSEFDEMFVGSGSRKVRQLFGAAKMRAPCVVFIDEIDSVGAKRTSSSIHPYANQTINQLLAEMDGFSPNDGVIVLGATNKRENLDAALLRPGRFDVEIKVMPPDMKGRQQIFELYLSKVKSSESLNTETLAKMTYGMTGADIQNIVNQAALKAALSDAPCVTMEHLDYARDKIMMGPAWKNKKIDKETNWNTACHEAGHTIVAYYSKGAKSLNKVTILPRGNSLGHTSFMPEKEIYGQTKTELLAEIDVCMGGRVGEEVVFGSENVTTGASSDFKRATAIADAMVKQFGMSEKVGQRVHVGKENMYVQVNDTSPELQQVLDKEIDRLLQESYQRATNIIKSHAKEHERLSQALMTYETLDKIEVEDVIKGKIMKKKIPILVTNSI